MKAYAAVIFGSLFWGTAEAQMVGRDQAQPATESSPQSPVPDQPEVTIRNTTRSMVISQLTDQLTPQKYRLASSSESMVVFEKDGGLLASIVAGSRFNPNVLVRMTFNFVELDSDIRVLGNAEMIGNPNSGFERHTALDTKGQRRDIQFLLETVQKMVTESRAHGKHSAWGRHITRTFRYTCINSDEDQPAGTEGDRGAFL